MDNLFFQHQLSDELLKSRKRSRGKDLRTAYFRDTTAIIHSYPFRRLKHKTQVFFSPKNDHICTRIEHVLHVASVAATICRSLNLDADLAWAIGLGHDLGHAPFGHLGEKILNELSKTKGGFIHELNSLRVVDYLVNYGKGLNLTYAVRDGIINHCGEKFERTMYPREELIELSCIKDREYYPITWEGVVVRLSDKIAYLGRDIEDAVQLNLITQDEIPASITSVIGGNNSGIIDTLVNDLIQYSLQNGTLGFTQDVFDAMVALKQFNYDKIYGNPELARYHDYFERILTTLHNYLSDLFSIYQFRYDKYLNEHNFLAGRFGDYLKKMETFYNSEKEGYARVISDYIAGMTDNYAIDCVSEIMIPKRFGTMFHDFILEHTSTEHPAP